MCISQSQSLDNSLGSMFGKKSSGKASPALGLGAAASNEGSETKWMPKYVWELLEPEMRRYAQQASRRT